MKKTLLTTLTFLISLINATAQNYEWAKGVPSAGSSVGKSITYDAAGNVYVTGGFYGTVDFDPGTGVSNLTSNGSSDIYILKLDAMGNFVWVKQIGGTALDQANAIHIDKGGDIYVTGFFSDSVDFNPGTDALDLIANGAKEIFALKLNSLGDFGWAKQFGGIENDEGYDITVDANRFVYVTGIFSNTVDFDPGASVNNLTSDGGYDGFVLKLLPSGDLNWVKKVGGTHSDDRSFAIALDANNNVYTTGYFRTTVDFDPSAATVNLTSNGMRDCYILKFDSNGNFIWVKSIGGGFQDSGNDIEIDDSGNAYVTGQFQYTVDFDPGSNTSNLVSSGILDAFILKLDATGNFVWAKNYGGTSLENSTSISLDGDGNIYTTGNFYETADFDPGTGSVNLTATASSSDIFILKLNPTGDYVWAGKIGELGDDIGYAITVDDACNIYSTGVYFDTADFDPGTGTSLLTNTGVGHMYALKLSCTLISSEIAQNNFYTAPLLLYPNPATSAITIDYEKKIEKIIVLDITGKTVKSLSTENKTIDLSDLVNGTYFLQVHANASIITTKFIKE
ncbi:MAG: SBBP repeat-containing protein [Flavobacteriales bacterium]|jgi:hypothetical protein|nr:SBBP repeat-containing protein [Flavobacteriales bacterium]